jgi:hypothetical protein
MADQTSYAGKCFCGAVEITASGEPVAMGYCHCGSCRQWSAGPVNAFTLWPPQSVRVTKGGEHVEGYQKTDTSVRKFCELCGGHLYTEHPLWGVTDVYAAIIPSQLCRDCAPYRGWAAEVQGHAGGDGRLGRPAAGVAPGGLTSRGATASTSAARYNQPWARYGNNSGASAR